MKFALRWIGLPGVLLGVICFGCAADPTPPRPDADPPSPAVKTPAAVKKVPVGKNVWLEIEGDRRRVVIDAYVCLREGALEQLLTRKHTKEHEAILAADMDARDAHKALLIAGLEPGHPVRYLEKEQKIVPPDGAKVLVTLQYKDDDKTVRVPARQWVRNVKTKKELDVDWVFAGSVFFQDPDDKTRPPSYAANGGDVICVSNFEGAMLDLPIKSSKDNAELSFEAWTDRIPPLKTRVLIILEGELAAKKK